jgi:hypothetical protein
MKINTHFKQKNNMFIIKRNITTEDSLKNHYTVTGKKLDRITNKGLIFQYTFDKAINTVNLNQFIREELETTYFKNYSQLLNLYRIIDSNPVKQIPYETYEILFTLLNTNNNTFHLNNNRFNLNDLKQHSNFNNYTPVRLLFRNLNYILETEYNKKDINFKNINQLHITLVFHSDLP